MGARYRTHLAGPERLSALPSPLRATYRAAERRYLGKTRGLVRDKNDRTLDNRAHHFAKWLANVGYDDVSILDLGEPQALPTVVSYLHHVAYEQGSQKSKTGLASGTLMGYVNSAKAWLQTKLSLACSDINQNQGMIADVLHEATKWRKPKPKREPYTYKMFEQLHRRIEKQRGKAAAALYERDAAVFDWARLSIYTGSRSGEYAQTVGTTTKASCVPDAPVAEEWAKEPIAFVASDFTFFSTDNCRVTLKEILENPKLAHELHVRFRYDKSGRNFTIRKFARGKGLLCPIDAAISILLRAAALNVPPGHPIGVHHNPRSKAASKVVLLQSSEVIKIMREVCLEAYPDKRHYYHINYMSIDAHSARVTAAVALSQAGVSKEDIAFRLRWKPESVDHYLRDCNRTIGTLTQAAVLGAMNIESST
jgi:hypothetical protein